MTVSFMREYSLCFSCCHVLLIPRTAGLFQRIRIKLEENCAFVEREHLQRSFYGTRCSLNGNIGDARRISHSRSLLTGFGMSSTLSISRLYISIVVATRRICIVFRIKTISPLSQRLRNQPLVPHSTHNTCGQALSQCLRQPPIVIISARCRPLHMHLDRWASGLPSLSLTEVG